MMIEDKILKALQTATTAAVAASPTPTMPIKFAGRVFTPPDDGGAYLETVFIPNNVQDEFWAEGKTYRGIYRLILHWPVDDKGAYGPLQTIGAISDYFAKGSIFIVAPAKVKIVDIPNLTGILEGAPESLYPVTVKYECVDTP